MCRSPALANSTCLVPISVRRCRAIDALVDRWLPPLSRSHEQLWPDHLPAGRCSSPSDGIKEQIVPSNTLRRTDHRSPRPVGPEGGWSKCRYLDAEAAHFIRQHFRYAFKSEFAARVIGDAR